MLKYTILASLIAAPVFADTQCADSNEVYDTLSEKYNEKQYSVAVAENMIVEMWVNDTTQSWSLIGTGGNGVSCLIGSGVGFIVTTRGGL